VTLYGAWRSFRRWLSTLSPFNHQFCPMQNCEHYGGKTKYRRTCYAAGPQCLRGFLDLMLQDIRVLIRIRFGRTERPDVIREVGD
jgi:hypothetical protein